ncbi:MAG: class II glutamine amidotransferase [Myxococcaceae bacterium]
MCRLFGLRAASPASVRDALLTHPNALRVQSKEHKDGWGIAYWEHPTATMQHNMGLAPAFADPNFEAVCSRVVARSVLAHVRLASVGAVEAQNAHPFREGRWAFAHNGTLHRFAEQQPALEALLPSERRTRLRGETDSERCFQLFLSHLADADSPKNVRAVATALALTMRSVEGLTDDVSGTSALNFLVTDGHVLVASRRGRSLFFATSSETAAPAPGTRVEHFLVSSEALHNNAPWHPVADNELIGVDADLSFHRWSLEELAG